MVDLAKDYTDYFALILEAEKRVFHIYHRRAKTTADEQFIEHNGKNYVFDRDRAYRVKWAPWKKTDAKHPLRSINELLRGKKVGMLLYREPLPGEPKIKEVQHKTPKEFICKTCGFTTVHLSGIKRHLTATHKFKDHGPHIRIGYDIRIEKVRYYDPIQPIHISRMHQPSGALRATDPIKEVQS